MDPLQNIILPIELHDVAGIRHYFASGVNPNDRYRNEPLLYALISEYTRTTRFKDCVKAFVEYGLQFDDPVLLAVLLDDASLLSSLLASHPAAITKKYTLRAAYTPLYAVTLLHICAEFNHVSCAEVLVQQGAGIDAQAGVDENGFGGQTPVFHTVNQNGNQSAGMLTYLLAQGADLALTVKGLTWGKTYEWETFIPAVNPISYAMMGLLPQMHRDEQTVAATVRILLKHAFGIDYTLPNVPCKYLQA